MRRSGCSRSAALSVHSCSVATQTPIFKRQHDTRTALRSWVEDHRAVWETLRKRERTVELVAVVRIETVLEHPAGAGNPTEHDPAAVREITRIEQAILDGDARILDEFGGLQKAVQRSVALKKRLRHAAGPGSIRRRTARQTARLFGAFTR